MYTEDNINYVFRKITKDEFGRLHDLFPDSEQMWLKFRNIRWKEFDNREIDIYVIEQNNSFIGELTIHYISHDLASETIPGQRVYLQAFRVDKKYQGFGLGKKILQYVLTDLEQKGYTEFTIGVEEDNEKAKHIYFKFGFTEAIDKGLGDEFDPSDYTLYLRKIEKGVKNVDWKDADHSLPLELLSRFTEMSKKVLGDNLTGVYLHGSAVMGCFNPEKSDLDLILAVQNTVPDAVKMEFMENAVKLNEEAPQNGFEWSIVKRDACKPFVYPTPYELHFSITHLKWFQKDPKGYIQKMRGVDKDLAAHFTIINHYGKTLFGEEIESVFDEVPRKDYIDSIWLDVQNAREEIVSNPVYVILNLCRVLAYLRDGSVLSKKAGGQWGMDNLSERYFPLLQNALAVYTGSGRFSFPSESMQEFAGDMIAKIEMLK